jgi:PTH1 family peptidyl-tRNA hydrolase
MYLIAGLGNPGDKYELTRHNIGFLVIDEITKNQTLTNNLNNPNFKAIAVKSSNNILVKPQTYMNLSGESIVAIADYYNIPNENIIIIHDDLDLPFGAIKFKIGGGHGGHNGLKSIDANIGKDYIRVRIGIGKPENKDVANYVLSNFSKEELNHIGDIISHSIKAIDMLKKEPIDIVKSTMTKKSLG